MITSDVSEMDSWTYKYVRFNDGTFLFGRQTTCFEDHKWIASFKPELKPVSTGLFRYDAEHKEWCMKDRGSTGLKVPSLGEDDALIEKLLGSVENIELSYW